MDSGWQNSDISIKNIQFYIFMECFTLSHQPFFNHLFFLYYLNFLKLYLAFILFIIWKKDSLILR